MHMPTPAPPVLMTCRNCGKSWTVMAKANGAMPKGSRCPVSEGGCGTFARVPAPAARTAAPVIALIWDPSSARYYPRMTTESCPQCGAPLNGTRTLRACPVHQRVPPRGVCAPYQRETATGRQVKSQRERDAEGRALEARRERLASELETALTDSRLTPEARGILKWYRDAVDKAESLTRLDDLVDQARGERLPRAGAPTRPVAAELEPPGYDDDDQDDGDWEDGEGEPELSAAAPAVVDVAAELAARGCWIRDDAPAGRCQIAMLHAPCTLAAPRMIEGMRICEGHWHALTASPRRRPA
jgi:uncharacterized Zn finger protein (UPF0148 family)